MPMISREATKLSYGGISPVPLRRQLKYETLDVKGNSVSTRHASFADHR